MVHKLIWIIGIGIPASLMLYFALVGFDIVFDADALQLGYKPIIEFAWLFLAISLVSFFGLYYHVTMRSMAHGRHCELTSMAEAIAVVGFFLVVILGVGYEFPFGNYADWFYFSLTIGIAGAIGIVLYRAERRKWPF